MKYGLAYLSGLLFGLGIVLSGMANPAKVVNFFDLAGAWDPSLAFVMGGALTVTAIGYRIILRKSAPVCDTMFHMPTKTGMDKRLIGGSLVFGVGWGVAGFCPGGALPVVSTGNPGVLIFVTALVAGILIARFAQNTLDKGPTAAQH